MNLNNNSHSLYNIQYTLLYSPSIDLYIQQYNH